MGARARAPLAGGERAGERAHWGAGGLLSHSGAWRAGGAGPPGRAQASQRDRTARNGPAQPGPLAYRRRFEPRQPRASRRPSPASRAAPVMGPATTRAAAGPRRRARRGWGPCHWRSAESSKLLPGSRDAAALVSLAEPLARASSRDFFSPPRSPFFILPFCFME